MAIAEHEPNKLYGKNKSLLGMSHQQLHDFAATPGEGVAGKGWSVTKEDAETMIRLYLDCFEGDRAIWQVDNGAGSTTWKVTEVQIRGAHGVTRQNLQADNRNEPKCWLEYDGEVTIHQGIALIRRKHGQLSAEGDKASGRTDCGREEAWRVQDAGS